MEAWKEELYHHGIKGQTWGIRKGPPYPLEEHRTIRKDKNKKIAIITGVSTLGVAAAFLSLNPRVRNFTRNAIQKIAKFKIKDVVQKVKTGLKFSNEIGVNEYTERDRDMMELMRLLSEVYDNTEQYLNI